MPRKLKIHERITTVVEYERSLNKFFSRRDALYIIDILLILDALKYVVAEKLYRESKFYKTAAEYLKERDLISFQYGDRASVLYLTERGKELASLIKRVLEFLKYSEDNE